MSKASITIKYTTMANESRISSTSISAKITNASKSSVAFTNMLKLMILGAILLILYQTSIALVFHSVWEGLRRRQTQRKTKDLARAVDCLEIHQAIVKKNERGLDDEHLSIRQSARIPLKKGVR